MPSSSGERKLNAAGHQDQRTKRLAGPKLMFSSEHTICAVDTEVWHAIKALRPRISGSTNILSSSPRRTMPVLR